MPPSRAKKQLPRQLQAASDGARQSPVLGGSLTVSADGQLQTLQTHGMYPSPLAMQDLWTNASRRRYPEAWAGEELAAVGYTVEWERHGVACGACGRSLGEYVGYRIRYAVQSDFGEHGVVEKTSRRYERSVMTPRGAGTRGPKPRPRFDVTGEVGRRAAKATAIFWCRGCKREHHRNLSTLGREFFKRPRGETFLLE